MKLRNQSDHAMLRGTKLKIVNTELLCLATVNRVDPPVKLVGSSGFAIHAAVSKLKRSV